MALRPEMDEATELGRIALAQLWRIEGALAAVRAELALIAGTGGDELRRQATAVQVRCRQELAGALPESLVTELERLLSWSDSGLRSDGELRVALAQLDGWLSGVLSGLGFVVSVSSGG